MAALRSLMRLLPGQYILIPQDPGGSFPVFVPGSDMRFGMVVQNSGSDCPYLVNQYVGYLQSKGQQFKDLDGNNYIFIWEQDMCMEIQFGV